MGLNLKLFQISDLGIGVKRKLLVKVYILVLIDVTFL